MTVLRILDWEGGEPSPSSSLTAPVALTSSFTKLSRLLVLREGRGLHGNQTIEISRTLHINITTILP